MEPRVLAEQDYLTGMKYKDIADKYGVTINTVKSWKTRYKWSRAPTEKGVHTKRAGAKQVRTPPQAIEISDKLTEKQRTFLMEYMRDFNATRAAMVVGYSKRTAYSIGWELLRKPEIQAEVKRMREMMAEEYGLDIRRIITEYMRIAFADITDYAEFGQQDMPLVTKNGPVIDPKTGDVMKVKESFVAFRDHSQVDGTVIAEVKQGKDGVSIKLHDKMRALEKLERYVGYMTTEEKLRLAKLQAEVKALEGPGDVKTDDGFIDALKGKSAVIWADEPAEKEETDEVENESEDE